MIRLHTLQMTLLFALNIVLRTLLLICFHIVYPKLMKTYLMINSCHFQKNQLVFGPNLMFGS